MIFTKDQFFVQDALNDYDQLYAVLYYVEKNSEHPLARSICKKVEELIPGYLEQIQEKISIKSFKNREGEGVQAVLINKETNEEKIILVGNDKLMRTQNVTQFDDVMHQNVVQLEQEGATVIIMAINNIPQMIVQLQEEHLVKHEARPVL